MGIGEAFRKRVELGLGFLFVDMVVMRAVFLSCINLCIHTILTLSYVIYIASNHIVIGVLLPLMAYSEHVGYLTDNPPCFLGMA